MSYGIRCRTDTPAIARDQPWGVFSPQIVSLLLHSFAFDVHENLKKNVAFHLAKTPRSGIVCHRHRGLDIVISSQRNRGDQFCRCRIDVNWIAKWATETVEADSHSVSVGQTDVFAETQAVGPEKVNVNI